MKNNDISQQASAFYQETSGTEAASIRLETEIAALRKRSNRGIYALALFLLIAMIAWQGFTQLPSPEKVIAVLGTPPSAQMISIALLLYTFSAIMLSLSRMMGGIEHKSSFSHVGYLTGFFLFYHFAKGLDDNYWAVLGSGMTILGVESYRIWTFCNEAIVRKIEQLDYIRRTGRLPLED
ncbi:menaquinol oxidoreductase [Pelotalea chapellei]|uniref:Menaquinol oxidoreductase n=1 Tax=Pelotalea chapellei TaxID=44671 RepID=A0ABS5UCW8_9BACT|nr:menaquinol oxidoreductase [Pelotalea chapellei]MBT1073478.1 menaquinol oxidoreductase [Pelotalea chapellei]